MRKIVVLDGYAANPGDLSWLPLQELGELTVYDRTSPTELITRAKGAEMVLTNKVIFGKEQIDALPELKYIGVNATGYNVVDTVYAHKRGIVVTNIPAYSTDSVAQMVFAHLLNVTNRVEHYAQEARAGRWSRNPDFCYWNTPLMELAGKTIGIIGLGNIGMKVANIAHQFGMDVFAFTSKNSADLPDGIQKTTMDGLFATSDVITLHCPLTADTYHLVNRERFNNMKQGAVLINTGRGQLIDEYAVAEALTDGRLQAYCADVMEEEPPSADNPLLRCHNAFLTPHIAWASYEARKRLMDVVIENARAYVAGQPQNMV